MAGWHRLWSGSVSRDGWVGPVGAWAGPAGPVSSHYTMYTVQDHGTQRPLGAPSGGHGAGLEAPVRRGTRVLSPRIPDGHSSPGSPSGGSGLGCGAWRS